MATDGSDSILQIPGNVGSNRSGSSTINIDPEELSFRRLLPRHLPRAANHIYVNLNTNFKNQFVRGKNILSNEGDFILVHGLGLGMEKAINLAHKIQNAIPTVNIDSQTSGFHVNEELAFMLAGDRQTRSVPIVHMKLYKPSKQDNDR